jgi:hypothetical protein
MRSPIVMFELEAAAAATAVQLQQPNGSDPPKERGRGRRRRIVVRSHSAASKTTSGKTESTISTDARGGWTDPKSSNRHLEQVWRSKRDSGDALQHDYDAPKEHTRCDDEGPLDPDVNRTHQDTAV